MIVIDSYRKGWALRYLREAKTELAIAQESPETAPSFILDSMKKAQAAIYHSLGDAVLIENMIQQKVSEENVEQDPILRCLIEIERSIQQVANLRDPMGERTLKAAEDVLSLASEIIGLFIGETKA